MWFPAPSGPAHLLPFRHSVAAAAWSLPVAGCPGRGCHVAWDANLLAGPRRQSRDTARALGSQSGSTGPTRDDRALVETMQGAKGTATSGVLPWPGFPSWALWRGGFSSPLGSCCPLPEAHTARSASGPRAAVRPRGLLRTRPQVRRAPATWQNGSGDSILPCLGSWGQSTGEGMFRSLTTDPS